jgi:hypothetical protein
MAFGIDQSAARGEIIPLSHWDYHAILPQPSQTIRVMILDLQATHFHTSISQLEMQNRIISMNHIYTLSTELDHRYGCSDGGVPKAACILYLRPENSTLSKQKTSKHSGFYPVLADLPKL